MSALHQKRHSDRGAGTGLCHATRFVCGGSMNWIGDAAAHDTGDLVEIGFGIETVKFFQLILGFGAQLHRLQDTIDLGAHYGDSASAFMASSASLKRFVRRARASALAWSVPSGP